MEDVAKQKLESDAKLEYMPEANVNREVMQELERSRPAATSSMSISVNQFYKISHRCTRCLWGTSAQRPGIYWRNEGNCEKDTA